jgi:hypothetical protein
LTWFGTLIYASAWRLDGIKEIPKEIGMKRSLYLSLIAAGLLLAAAAGPAAKADSRDGAAVWTQLGPPGGNIVALARHTNSPSKIYALSGGFPGQFFRSADNGTTWKRMAVFQDTAYDIAVDPKNGDIVYVLSYRALSKSTNTGESFTEIPFPTGMYGNGRMAVCPKDSNILYLPGQQQGMSGDSQVGGRREDLDGDKIRYGSGIFHRRRDRRLSQESQHYLFLRIFLWHELAEIQPDLSIKKRGEQMGEHHGAHLESKRHNSLRPGR